MVLPGIFVEDQDSVVIGLVWEEEEGGWGHGVGGVAERV